ncbi:CPBP family intramembrane glutamic endopeptidase [Algoriphagus sp. SE2]|uniref:CPBP family intramembrane glutamic endopeptidase n=1 Tax=Algoriphagus sp. SE2 TaxID=3141536 RepID=UPI0031CD5477
MKNIWQNIPPWGKALLLILVWLYPIVVLVRTISQYNVRTESTFGWGLFVIVVVLFFYWKVAKKCNPIKEDDIRFTFIIHEPSRYEWSSLLGVVFTMLGAFLLSALIFDTTTTNQLAFINSFKSLTPMVAIPLLAGHALAAGVVEEITFRGILHNAMRSYTAWVRYMLVAVLFTFMHFLPMPLLIPYILVSLLLSHVAEKNKSIGVVLYAHFIVDLVIFLCLYEDVIIIGQLTSFHLVLGLSFVLSGLVLCFYGLYGVQIKPSKLSIHP